MKLEEVLLDPASTLDYMEQQVNVGSPSGFGNEVQLSDAYAPGGTGGPFPLWTCSGQIPAFTTQIGYIPSRVLPTSADESCIAIHPRMASHSDLQRDYIKLFDTQSPLFIPTSSGRTVRLTAGDRRWYVKLHYAGLLGRIDRRLPLQKAIAGVEMSQELESAIKQGRVPPTTFIMREVGARVLHLDNITSWGMVIREPVPYGASSHATRALIPLFSFFSPDRRSPDDPLLLEQLLDHWGTNAEAKLCDSILGPIVDGFFELIIQQGIQIELNAQNMLVAFNADMHAVGIVIRDLMGAEKDLPIRRALGLKVNFESSPYKCIDSTDPTNYVIRHSFAFDFKLSHYVLAPIIAAAATSRRSAVKVSADNCSAYIRDVAASVTG